MGELTQTEAYRQLLQVTENLLNQLSPQQQIIRKYLTLKKSMLAKVKSNPPDKSYVTKILIAYKSLTKNTLQCITQFQAEIQGEMNKTNFLRNSAKLLKQIQKQCKILSEELNYASEQNKNLKLLMKQQLNAYKFTIKQFEGKIENMGLMIQVHRKMHQIILQASEKQIKTSQKEAEYNKRLNQMQNVVDRIEDVKKFIQSYEMTEKKARKFQMARKNLAKVLFDL